LDPARNRQVLAGGPKNGCARFHREGTSERGQTKYGVPIPLGRLATGEAYYAPIGQMRRDQVGVQCHLCGRWLKRVGGSHLVAAHGLTVSEYREMFHLNDNVSTNAPDVSTRQGESMLEQITFGQREPAVKTRPGPATVSRWRSLPVLQPALASEIHPTRTADLDAFALGPYSGRRIWRLCSGCGHEWRSTPHQRMHQRGCPACARRRSINALAASVDIRNARPPRALARIRPDLVAGWHPTRNGDLTPENVAAGSERKVWWLCSTDGCHHEWQAVIGQRTRRGLGCPACGFARAGRNRAIPTPDKSLATLYPKLLDEWHPDRNGDLDPHELKPGSEQRVWWKCKYCANEWQAPPQSRKRSRRGGCPTCATRLARGIEPGLLGRLGA